MKILAGGCRVYSADDGQFSTVGNWTARTVISHGSGARRITRTAIATGSSTRDPASPAKIVDYVATAVDGG